MDSTLFVITKLTELIKLFTNLRVRYEFKKESIVHLIEVYPKEVYQSNEDYISWESKLYDKFTEQYPLENICFISEDAFVKVENPIFVSEGLNYAPLSSLPQETISFKMENVLSSSMAVDYNHDLKQILMESVKVNDVNLVYQYSQAA